MDQDLEGLKAPNTASGERFDAIVVGAGPAGNAAAYTWPRPG